MEFTCKVRASLTVLTNIGVIPGFWEGTLRRSAKGEVRSVRIRFTDGEEAYVYHWVEARKCRGLKLDGDGYIDAKGWLGHPIDFPKLIREQDEMDKELEEA